MPARRIVNNEATVSRFSVLGFDSEEKPRYICHVALAMTASKVGTQIAPKIADMIPPLLVGRPLGNLVVTCVGEADLAEFERQAIASFVTTVKSEFDAEERRRKQLRIWKTNEYRSDQYIVRPHVQWATADRRYPRFSCAGFVHEAYAAAGIRLVNTDESQMPRFSREELAQVFPSHQLTDASFCHTSGLVGSGPWPILLPGHILNSMNRSRSAIDSMAYVPLAGDEYFPSRMARVPWLSGTMRLLREWCISAVRTIWHLCVTAIRRSE